MSCSPKHLYNPTFSENYSKLLREANEAAVTSPEIHSLSRIIDMPDLGSPSIVFKQFNGGHVDLVTKTGDESVEVIYTVHGFASQVSLGPVQSSPPHPEKAQQSVQLVDLDTGIIPKCLDGLAKIHMRFEQHLSPVTVEMVKNSSDFQGHIGLLFGNRYFSTKADANGLPAIDFATDIDPRGIMGNLDIPQYHTEDNVVQCYQKNLNSSTYSKISCGAVYPCDLLELQVAFCAVPIRRHKYRMLSKLRSVCVLDRVAEMNALKTHLSELRTLTHIVPLRPKRRHGYVTDDDSISHAAQRMRLES